MKTKEERLNTSDRVNKPDKLNLKKIDAFVMIASDDEYHESEKGYFRDRNEAVIHSKKAGWYGSDGDVKPVSIYEDVSTKKLYKVEVIGEEGIFSDNERITREKILSKLTKEEMEFLGLKLKY